MDVSTEAGRHIVSYDFGTVAEAIIRSIGQVCFFDQLVPGSCVHHGALRLTLLTPSADFAGILVAVGVLVASRIAFVAAVCSACIGVFGAVALGAPELEVNQGLWGYDAVLAGLCVGGIFFRLSMRGAVLAVFAAVMATLLHGAVRSALFPVGLPPLTFAAATTCFLFTSMAKTLNGVHVMPLSEVALPEENFPLRSKQE